MPRADLQLLTCDRSDREEDAKAPAEERSHGHKYVPGAQEIEAGAC